MYLLPRHSVWPACTHACLSLFFLAFNLSDCASSSCAVAVVDCRKFTGPGGRSLTEIQHRSGANIQISSKGIFAPGTKNRIVKISGQPKSLSLAQFLIEQKINEEETKRARQSITSPGGGGGAGATAAALAAGLMMGNSSGGGVLAGVGAMTNLAGVMQ